MLNLKFLCSTKDGATSLLSEKAAIKFGAKIPMTSKLRLHKELELHMRYISTTEP